MLLATEAPFQIAVSDVDRLLRKKFEQDRSPDADWQYGTPLAHIQRRKRHPVVVHTWL